MLRRSRVALVILFGLGISSSFLWLFLLGQWYLGDFFLDDHYLRFQYLSQVPLWKMFWFQIPESIDAWFTIRNGSHFFRPLAAFTHGIDFYLQLNYGSALIHTLLYRSLFQALLFYTVWKFAPQLIKVYPLLAGLLALNLLLDDTNLALMWVSQRNTVLVLLFGISSVLLANIMKGTGRRNLLWAYFLFIAMAMLTSELGFICGLCLLWIGYRLIGSCRIYAFISAPFAGLSVLAYIYLRGVSGQGSSNLYFSMSDLMFGPMAFKLTYLQSCLSNFMGLYLSFFADIGYLELGWIVNSIVSLLGLLFFGVLLGISLKYRCKMMLSILVSMCLVILAVSLTAAASRNIIIPRLLLLWWLGYLVSHKAKEPAQKRITTGIQGLTYLCLIPLIVGIPVTFIRASQWEHKKVYESETSKVIASVQKLNKLPVFLATNDYWLVETAFLSTLASKDNSPDPRLVILSESTQMPSWKVDERDQQSCLIELSAESFFTHATDHKSSLLDLRNSQTLSSGIGRASFYRLGETVNRVEVILLKNFLNDLIVLAPKPEVYASGYLKYTIDSQCKAHEMMGQ